MVSDLLSCQEETQASRTAWKKQGLAELPRNSQTRLGRDSERLSCLERALSNLLICLQAVQCAPASQFCELSSMLVWDLMMQLSLSNFCSSK